MSSTAKIILFMGVASFVAFSIGLNMGLLGFFHGEIVTVQPTRAYVENSLVDHRHIVHNHEKVLQQNDQPLSVSTAQPVETDPIELLPLTVVPTEPKAQSHVAMTQAQPAKSIISAEEISGGPISEFLAAGKELPIALLTCNRLELLEQTIQSLLAVTGISKDIIIFQDGEVPGVGTIAKKFNLQLVQNKARSGLRNQEGAARIAKHYKFSLTTVFEMRPEAPAVIIIEDDLLFSPDFYQYFVHTAPLLEKDPSTLVISAWNDNGFKGRVQDPYELRRTDYFPGLGWLLSRKLYKTELEAKWPQNHWDHWLRSHNIHQGREIIYPQVPRTFHNGIKGTFMNMETHNRYFRDIAYNKDTSVEWPVFTTNPAVDVISPYRGVLKANYESRVEDLVKSKCHHVTHPREIMGQPDLDPDPQFGAAPFEAIGTFFGLWHEHRRGAHKNMHEFYWSNPTADKSVNSKSSYILLLNTFGDPQKSYSNFKPRDVPTLQPRDFRVGNQMLRGSQ